MSLLYRVKIKLRGSYKDVGHLVINEDGTGFGILELLPGTVLRIERNRSEVKLKAEESTQATNGNPLPPSSLYSSGETE